MDLKWLFTLFDAWIASMCLKAWCLMEPVSQKFGFAQSVGAGMLSRIAIKNHHNTQLKKIMDPDAHVAFKTMEFNLIKLDLIMN